MTPSTPGDQPARAPSRNDDRNDSPAICPACGQPFTAAGRRAAWRRRHSAPRPDAAALPPAARDATIYQCPDCEQRYLGQQRCDDCGTFCRRIGPGGPCPHCDEPVAIKDLTTVS